MNKVATAFLLTGLYFVLPLTGHAAQKIATSTTWEYKRPSVDLQYGSEIGSRPAYDDEDTLKIFRVRDTSLYEDDVWFYDARTNKLEDIDFKLAQRDKTDEYRIWSIFTRIAPQSFVKQYMHTYITFRDPEDPILGVVWKESKSDPAWFLAVNANAADFNDKKWKRDMTVTLLHEFGHVLTLNSTQMVYSRKNEFKCSKGFMHTPMGCAKKTAYLTAFYSQFWDENDRAYEVRVSAEKDPVTSSRLVRKYYLKHPDDFVTQYAATSPEEDITESFASFVLEQKPLTLTTKKDKKISFFYQYPELVTLRDKIRLNIRQNFE